MDTSGHVCPNEESLVLFAATHAGLRQAQAAFAVCPRCTRLLQEMERDRGLEADLRSVAQRAFVTSTYESRGLAPVAKVDDRLPAIAGYVVQEELHRGGQGVVYRAVQDSTKRPVAVKLLLAGQLATLRERYRFEREIEIASSLKHANIVSIFEGLETTDGRLGYAMELIDGVSLDAWAAARRASAPRATREHQRASLELMVKVCRAVQYAHARGVIHRDLKPGNILIDTTDEPHVLDFGLARRDDEPALRVSDGGSSITMPGEFLGTPQYASPEQMELAQSEVDGRADVYALGVMLYKLVCGQMPYAVDGSVKQIIESVCRSEPANPRQTAAKNKFADVDLDLETILLKALAKDRERRYQTALSLAQDLALFLEGGAIEARRDSAWYVIRKRLQAHRVEVAAAAAVTIVALGATVAGLVLSARASDARQREELERRLREEQAIRAAAVATVIAEILPPADQSNAEPPSRWLEDNLLDVREAMDAGWLSDQPELAAQVQSVLSDIYALRGTRSGWYAESSARNAKTLLREAYGDDDPRVLRMEEAEVAALIARKRTVEALNQAQSLVRRWDAMGPQWTARADATRTLLAQAQLQAGKSDDAEATARSVLASADLLTHPDTSSRAWNVLAEVLEARGDVVHAEEACVAALRARMSRRRDTDADVIASLAMLARLQSASPQPSRPDKAALTSLVDALRAAEGSRDLLALTQHADTLLALKSWLFGPESIEVAESLALVGNSYRRLHNWKGCTQWSTKAAQMLERTLPAPSIAVVNLYSSAAEGCRMRIDSRSEADLSLHAVAAIRRIPRERVEPIYFAAVLRDAAWCCGHADRFEEGQALMQESLDLFRSILGDQGHVVATTHARFADLYLRWNKPAEALEHARRAFELGDTAASMPTDQRLEMLSSLVRALLANGLTAEAQTAAERFGALNDSFFGDVTRHGYLNHESWWMLARANWTLSVAARANGDADRADALVQQSVADWRRAADWLQSSYGSPPGNEPPWREYGVPLLRDEKLTF